jgi:magnesium transporter
MDTDNNNIEVEAVVNSNVEKVGTAPGSLVYTGNLRDVAGRIDVIRFSDNAFSITTLEELTEVSSSPFEEESIWIRVIGLNDLDRIKQLGDQFQLDELVLEDILNVHQRPSLHQEQRFVYAVAKLLMFDKQSKKVKLHQAALILKNTVLISFEETEEFCISNVLNRLQNNVGKVRKRGLDYLFYSLLDSIIDNYYYTVRKLSDEFLQLEEEISQIQTLNGFQQIHHLRNQINRSIKHVIPIKEVTNSLHKFESRHIKKDLKPYLRDLHDQTLDIMDSLNSLGNRSATLLEILISYNSFKMNEIVKVLTIISTIFLPLTFIVGLYGMNFKNMPELEWAYGYYFVLGFMLALIFLMGYYIKKKNWL